MKIKGIIVVSMVSIALLALIIPAFSLKVQKTRDFSYSVAIRQMLAGIAVYEQEYGKMPDRLDDIFLKYPDLGKKSGYVHDNNETTFSKYKYISDAKFSQDTVIELEYVSLKYIGRKNGEVVTVKVK